MKTPLLARLAIAIFGLSLSGYAQETNLAGAWAGTLDITGNKLRLVFKVRRAAEGALTGTMDSPDQGARGIPITVSPVKNGAVHFDVPGVGSYEGTLDRGGNKISGKWTQGAADLTLNLAKVDPSQAGKPLARKANPESIEVNKKTGGKLVGAWEGTLRAGADLRLVLHVASTSDGGLVGTMDSLDQGAKDIPITAISYKEPKIRIETKTIGGAFEGQLKDGELTGNWLQLGQTFPLTLKKKR